MTSAKQAAANCRNAERSTGPRTDEGKAITRMNAVKHGGLSPRPVVTAVEKPEEWEGHLAGIVASLSPAGHLETVLTERVALILWRMSRVARYERETIAVSQERMVEDLKERRADPFSNSQGPSHPDDVRDALRSGQEQLRRLERLHDLPDDAPTSGEEADLMLVAVAERTENVDWDTFSMPDVIPDEIAWEDYPGWTAGRVRRAIAAIAAEEHVDADSLLQAAREHAHLETLKLEHEVKQVATELGRMQRERLLPDAGTLEKLARYEAHLSRQLAQALHELQRLQATRAGDPVPLPAALDVTVSSLA